MIRPHYNLWCDHLFFYSSLRDDSKKKMIMNGHIIGWGIRKMAFFLLYISVAFGETDFEPIIPSETI